MRTYNKMKILTKLYSKCFIFEDFQLISIKRDWHLKFGAMRALNDLFSVVIVLCTSVQKHKLYVTRLGVLMGQKSKTLTFYIEKKIF